MKTSISHSRFQLPAAVRQLNNTLRGPSCPPHHASRITHHASGVALVVTLIMLSVITFMAIALLVLSRAEHGSVATETEQTQARLAAETGLQRAIARALGPMLAQNNEFSYDLLVSTNYINPLGFAPGVADPTNVNYDYRVGGGAFSWADRNQNIKNLWIDPRPPVFVTNRLSALGGSEFRFFLNLNRNTNASGPIFDPTGWLPVTNNGVLVTTPPNDTPVFSYFVGDPQWVGILSSPDRPHAPDNRFISRFAYFLVPASKTLDINSIHNYAKVPSLGLPMLNGDGFLRNQGVGAWEDNLAAFLVDLNTNLWPYLAASPGGPTYPPSQPYEYIFTDTAVANKGAAFDDALSVLRYRYNLSAGNQLPVSQLFGAGGTRAFASDFIDAYLTSRPDWLTWPPPLMTVDPDVVPLNGTPVPWAGAPNTNHIFTTQEIFDRSKFLTPGFPPTTPTIADRLLGAGNNTQSSYDQYTFYRMLAQLGSDTAGDAGRINLNYCNLDNQGHVMPNMETNFLPWLPEHFFTNTANALLRSYGYSFTITNIQIYPTNFYTPNVHRLLQLAANIYDGSTNQFGTNNLPTVFRPYFRQVVLPGGVPGVMIAGYREVTNDVVARFNANFPGARPPTVVLGYNHTSLDMYGIPDRGDPSLEPQVQGIPLIIGAKKGLPNFNEYGMQTQVTVTRKLQFRRQGTSSTTPIVETNQMYLVSITNTFGLEAWNSYFSAYPRNLQVRMEAVMLAVVTNELGTLLLSNAVPFQPVGANIAAGKWQGYGFPDTTPNSFRAVVRSFLFLTNSMYSDANHRFTLPGDFERGNGFPIPHWYLSLRPMVRVALVDTSVAPNRIVDYVSLDSQQAPTDLTPLLTGSTSCGSSYTESGDPGAMWCTNRIDPGLFSPTYGILNQVTVGLGNTTSSAWSRDQHRREVDFFRAQFGLGMLYYPDGTFSMTNTFQAPYASSRLMSFYNSLQANDPLVHYTIPDLVDQLSGSTNALAGGIPYELDTTYNSSMKALGGLDLYSNNIPVGASSPVNPHYRPWGGNPNQSGDTSPVATNWRLEVKDPLVTRSDAWNFPTNKYPSIGWLGRVHRGTPWQTVYLKATTNDWTRWQYWSGDTAAAFYYNAKGNTLSMPDAILSLPEGDRVILDLFSTAINDNAARGRLSINQEGLAAWSAVLSGVAVLTNATPEQFLKGAAMQPQQAPLSILPLPQVIPPAGSFNPLLTPTNRWPAVARIVNAINITRARHPDFRAVWWNYYGTNVWTNTFEHLGDVLAVPELTVASPFLNQGSMNNTFISGLDKGRYTLQQSVGTTEEMYERIPQQILGLLQCDHTPRFVIYAYGQALKPAEHSIVTGGPFFQLCTNYQVTAEAATRAVVRIEGAPTQPHAVIESFNVLPPD